jgi:cell surface protein SprA
MEQETNLRLSGTIGEKIAVNLKYNSKQDEQLFDPNNINVKYTGDEDEVIRSIEAGNITLSLSGSRYISYSTSSQGLFGVTSKFSMAIWTIRNSIQRRRAEEHPNLRMDNLRQILQFFAAGITQPVRCTM